MITEPNRTQHPDIKKLNINVSQLENATFEALSSWFGEVDCPNNAKKRPYLKEIFRVAKYEERFKNGEIGSSPIFSLFEFPQLTGQRADGEAEVMVTADDKIPDDAMDDDDEDPHADDDENQPTPTCSPKLEHTLPSIAGSGQSPATNLQGASSFNMGDLPVRGHPYSQPSLMQSDLSATGPSGFDGPSISVNNQPSMSQTHVMPLPEAYSDPHASSRRTSLYTSPTEYGSSSAPGLYQAWQQSNPPTASPVYSFQQQQQSPHSAGGYVEHQPVPLTQTPQYMEAPTFDPIHNAGASSLFRATSVPQGPVNPHTTHQFPNYLSTPGSGMKLDSLSRGHPQDDNDNNKRWH